MAAPASIPLDPAYKARIRASFARQKIMDLLGAKLSHIAPGEVHITLPFRADLVQQDGFLHAGVVSTIADSAGGYAGFTLMPAGSRVLTVEYKVNFLAPAQGDRAVAQGRVIKAGRTLTVTELETWAVRRNKRTLVARGQQTLICVTS